MLKTLRQIPSTKKLRQDDDELEAKTRQYNKLKKCEATSGFHFLKINMNSMEDGRSPHTKIKYHKTQMGSEVAENVQRELSGIS